MVSIRPKSKLSKADPLGIHELPGAVDVIMLSSHNYPIWHLGSKLVIRYI